MASYRFLVQQLCGYFNGCEFHHVPRAENDAADALSKLGSTRRSIPVDVSLEHIKEPSIKPSPESESIFIPADLKAPDAIAPDSARTSGQKTHSAAPGAAGSAATAPGAPDCVPRAAFISSGADVVMQEAISSSSSEAPAAGSMALESIVAAVLVVVTAPSWTQPFRDFLGMASSPKMT